MFNWKMSTGLYDCIAEDMSLRCLHGSPLFKALDIYLVKITMY